MPGGELEFERLGIDQVEIPELLPVLAHELGASGFEDCEQTVFGEVGWRPTDFDRPFVIEATPAELFISSGLHVRMTKPQVVKLARLFGEIETGPDDNVALTVAVFPNSYGMSITATHSRSDTYPGDLAGLVRELLHERDVAQARVGGIIEAWDFDQRELDARGGVYL